MFGEHRIVGHDFFCLEEAMIFGFWSFRIIVLTGEYLVLRGKGSPLVGLIYPVAFVVAPAALIESENEPVFCLIAELPPYHQSAP